MDSRLVNKLGALTGLRAIAALAVFAHHFMGIMDCRVIKGPIGGIAVSFFFVLSGFILVYVYKDRLNKTAIPKFYFTRFARIWPLHAVCLLWIASMASGYLPATEWPWLRGMSHWSLLQAWYPANNWVCCYNGVAWSISAEAFFYLMFPLLLLGTARQFWVKYVCVFAATFIGLVWMASTLPTHLPIKDVANEALDPRVFAHFFPPFRLLEFMTGMAAGIVFLARNTQPNSGDAVGHRSWQSTVKGTVLEIVVLALSVGCFQIFFSSGLFRHVHNIEVWGPTLKHWLSFSGGMFFHAAVIYVFARSAGWCARLSGTRVMVFSGEISFAFYMIHYPLISMLKEKFWFSSNFSHAYFAMFTLALCVGVSAWLYYLIEIPVKTTALKWYVGDFRLRQLAAEMIVKPMQRLAKSSLIFPLILLIVVPIAVTKVYKRADRKSFTAAAIVESASPEFQTVSFGDQVELLAADIVPRRGSSRVNTVWRFSRPGTAIAKIHFAGTDFESRQQQIFCGPEAIGQPLVVSMVVYQGKYELAEAVEVSLSIDGEEVSPKLSGRAIVSQTGNHYPIFSSQRIQEGVRMSRRAVLAR